MLLNWNYDTGCGRSRNLTAAWRQWGVSHVPIQVERQGGRGRCLSRNRNDISFHVMRHHIRNQSGVFWLRGPAGCCQCSSWGLFFSSWAISVSAGIIYNLQHAIISIRNCFSLSYISQQCTERDAYYRMSFLWSFLSPWLFVVRVGTTVVFLCEIS